MALINKLTAIADAIRAKTGKADEMTLDQMVTEIENISGGVGTSGVEVVTVTIETSNFSGKARYTDNNYGFNELILEADSTYTIVCIKGSFVVFSGYGFVCDSLQPNFSVDYLYDPNDEGMQVYYFNTNATLHVRNREGW